MALTPSTMLPLGTPAPDFQLPDVVSGASRRYADVAGDRATVVMFICNHCPYVVHVRAQLVALAADYLPQCAGFGMNAQFQFRHLRCLLLSNQRMAARLIPAEMKTTRISSRGQTKTTQRSNDTRPMARPPITTAEVGVIRFTSPLAD